MIPKLIFGSSISESNSGPISVSYPPPGTGYSIKAGDAILFHVCTAQASFPFSVSGNVTTSAPYGLLTTNLTTYRGSVFGRLAVSDGESGSEDFNLGVSVTDTFMGRCCIVTGWKAYLNDFFIAYGSSGGTSGSATTSATFFGAQMAVAIPRWYVTTIALGLVAADEVSALQGGFTTQASQAYTEILGVQKNITGGSALTMFLTRADNLYGARMTTGPALTLSGSRNYGFQFANFAGLPPVANDAQRVIAGRGATA